MQALQEGGRCRQTLPFRNILDREAVMLKVGESSVRRQILPRDSGVAPLIAIKRPTGALPYVSRRDPGSLPCIAIGTASSGLETIDQVTLALRLRLKLRRFLRSCCFMRRVRHCLDTTKSLQTVRIRSLVRPSISTDSLQRIRRARSSQRFSPKILFINEIVRDAGNSFRAALTRSGLRRFV